MSNNYMYAIDRSDEYLAHYGIKGMKWGVRKAVESGNARSLDRHFRKAQRKLARLRKRAESGAKYARRAKALGAGALATGGLTVAGVNGVSKAMGLIGGAGKTAINAVIKPGFRRDLGQSFYDKVQGKANQLTEWGNKTPFKDYANKKADHYYYTQFNDIWDHSKYKPGETPSDRLRAMERMREKSEKMRNVGNLTNAQLLRAGSALATAGLAAGAGYNAYRAATTKRAARKADEWERAMKDTFGTTGMSNKKARSKRNKRR